MQKTLVSRITNFVAKLFSKIYLKIISGYFFHKKEPDRYGFREHDSTPLLFWIVVLSMLLLIIYLNTREF